MSIAYLGLGSNLGARARWLSRALGALETDQARVLETSSVYETEPVGPVRDQPPFYNAAVALQTSLAPRELLRHCLAVEQALGRQRDVPKGPRTIDVDLLLYDDRCEHWPELSLPHPELSRRAFVLAPLLELAPALRDPRDGSALHDALRRVADEQAVARRGSLAALVADEDRCG